MEQFLESPRFPEEIGYGSGGGPVFYNSRAVSPNGQRKINIRRSQPLGTYTVSLASLTREQYEQVLSFFMTTFGGAVPFRFKDWNDYEVLEGWGVIKEGQLYKRYAVGPGVQFDRLIQKPVPGTVEFLDGSGIVDYATGKVTNCTATQWVGEFDVPCAFTNDTLSANLDDQDAFTASLQLDIVKVKS